MYLCSILGSIVFICIIVIIFVIMAVNSGVDVDYTPLKIILFCLLLASISGISCYYFDKKPHIELNTATYKTYIISDVIYDNPKNILIEKYIYDWKEPAYKKYLLFEDGSKLYLDGMSSDIPVNIEWKKYEQHK